MSDLRGLIEAGRALLNTTEGGEAECLRITTRMMR